MKQTMKKYGFIISQVLVGNSLYALAVVAFIMPCGLITGGTTGIGMFLYIKTGLAVSTFAAISNTVMFLLGAAVLGRQFAASTVVATVAYPAILSFFEHLPVNWQMTQDPLLAVICAGLLIGAGMGLILRTGTSSGGLDVPPLILYKKWGVPLSVSMYIMDFLILLLQMVRAEMEDILYGLLLVMIYTVVIDKAMMIGKAQTRVEIISERSDEIAAAIRDKLDRSCTYYKGRTGYMGRECLVVMTIIGSRELPGLKNMVEKIDSEAFLVAGRVSEVLGRGFSAKKEYRRPLPVDGETKNIV